MIDDEMETARPQKDWMSALPYEIDTEKKISTLLKRKTATDMNHILLFLAVKISQAWINRLIGECGLNWIFIRSCEYIHERLRTLTFLIDYSADYIFNLFNWMKKWREQNGIYFYLKPLT